jgi:PEP-CTERM motif
MSRADAVELYQDYVLAGGGSLAANVTPVNSSTLVSDLTVDGLNSTEISDLTAAVSASFGSGTGSGIGSLSPAGSVGNGAAPVPEPSTLLLAVLGLGILGFASRRRSVAQKCQLAD